MKKSSESLFNIRQVIELTGVSEFSLRGWESRYAALSPHRTETGRRLYTRKDVVKIKALKDLVDRGHRISVIANYSVPSLQSLLEERDLNISSGPATGVSSEPETSAGVEIDRDIQLLFQKLDQHLWDEVQDIIHRQKEKMKVKEYILHFLTYLLSQMGHQVMLERFSIAQEHILTAFIKESLYALKANAKKKNLKKNRRLVMATPEGDIHEIGILMASTLAVWQGVSVLYLGPHVPKADLCEICLRHQATHLLLASTLDKSEGAKDEFLQYINFIDRQLPSRISFWIAGRNGSKAAISLQRKFKILTTIQEFDQLINSKA